MQAFIPAMGEQYQTGRNYDHGPGQHTAVSVLSPYIRRRLVTELEVVAAALAAHGPDAAKTYIEEVIWRGYFKGWLERRPLPAQTKIRSIKTQYIVALAPEGATSSTGAQIALPNREACTEIEVAMHEIHKIETALEPRFQEHFVNASAIPNAVEPFPILKLIVTLLDVNHNTGGEGCCRRRRRKPSAE